jgi:hypothetical protein
MKPAEFEAHIAGFYRTLRKRLLGSDELDGGLEFESGTSKLQRLSWQVHSERPGRLRMRAPFLRPRRAEDPWSRGNRAG